MENKCSFCNANGTDKPCAYPGEHKPGCLRDMVFNKQEREFMLIKMGDISSLFYGVAASIGNHPFLEFTGLINEYIKLCEEANAKGIDFTQCNKHSGIPLPMNEHNKKYITEKLECIFNGQIFLSK